MNALKNNNNIPIHYLKSISVSVIGELVVLLELLESTLI
jgi:hypothetical protein